MNSLHLFVIRGTPAAGNHEAHATLAEKVPPLHGKIQASQNFYGKVIQTQAATKWDAPVPASVIREVGLKRSVCLKTSE